MDVEMSQFQSELFDLIRNIKDPEHPESLEALKVVNLEGLRVTPVRSPSSSHSISQDSSTQHLDLSSRKPMVNPSEQKYNVYVEFTPTVPHCSLATLIGLCIRVKLEEAYPGQLKLDVVVKEGSHNTAAEISKQLNDKERVAAAMENPQMKTMVTECLAYS